MKNYQEAEKVLLANKITEDLICLVGMNRKSKTYDKIFFQLYQLLKAIFIDKSNQNYLKTFEIISKITGKSSIHWKNLIFKTNRKEKVKRIKKNLLMIILLLKFLKMKMNLKSYFLNIYILLKLWQLLKIILI